MHPIIIPDDATFENFANGQSVTVYPLLTEDYLNQIKQDGMRVQVWHLANTPPQRHHIGRVLNIGRTVETVPKGKPEAIELVIQIE